MALLRWAKPALEDLDAIAEYIALDDLSAARVAAPDTASVATARGISASATWNVTLTDVIIDVPNFGAVIQPRAATTWRRVTMNCPTNCVFFTGTAAAGSLTIRDSIFSDTGTKFGGTLPTGGLNVNYCGLPTAGPKAITARGSGTFGANINSSDPIYLNYTNPLLSTFLDVDNGRPAGHPLGTGYGTSTEAGTGLGGGADYIGGTVPVTMSGFAVD